ncbi:hypothetical protein ABB37_03005 [Leptomonas pyrrhocoris]|uniref:Uncharacterized protein n=1 Tax=Leptomonas pyrrhocoris TaxID=157538 RepID=A0A0N0VGD3_LEPPY|nr:hypothetical protein ABB37_03005 [Leptomonas pyrrhocoris]XP_015661793.1 hypothetical protein ABB37_03005 [Leptomonas pyrrhocoris]KPA83353.1 hypothetical protein ABB37_03005 [Leptomonas pyrrhocoris]KPA83354.1 hypothetical protein ABB37_03005 [Leptomonas pyrrhocoris]|eukprot:XP_015661792.1 hypothetical protein ABB37_03005 [Leptomonas pyrrhocoris]
MLPPHTVYSLVIRNHSDKKVKVAVTYADVEDNVHHAEISVPANGSATAEERTYKHGTAVFAMEVTKVAIVDATVQGPPSSLSAPFPSVYSPTKKYPIEIVKKNGAPALVTKESA